jgi:hypothetical protein
VTLAERSQKLDVLEVTCYTFAPSPVLLVGNTPQTGDWDPQRGLPLQFTGSLRGREQWQGTVELQPGQTIEFKFVHQGADGPEWELGENRTYTAESATGYLQSYFRAGNDAWQRLLAGDRVVGGGNLTARGDIVRALEILVFLANSGDRGMRAATLETIPDNAANGIRDAVAADGHDADKELDAISVLTIVSGRCSREVVVAHLPTSDLDQSSIDYVFEDSIAIGSLYRNPIW